jgi:class 3 adenylate cyclase
VDIAAWLHGLGLQQYEQAFRDNAIDAAVLPELTGEDLRDLGISLVGHRRKLLGAVAALRSHIAPASVASAASAERRQLTVMFCDLVGSTALSVRRDPEDLRDLIAAYHHAVNEVVRRFDGFVARYMGDGILIYFGYPRAHEDDAERAARCALAMVDAVSGLQLGEELHARVGIATGMVVVGGGAAEHDVVGETPNLAARLQTSAEPNAVLIAANTRQLIGGLFEYRDLGGVEARGFTGTVSAWQVLRPSAIASRFEALRPSSPTPLVGRDEELEILLRRWKRAKKGEGQVVLLSGEPGIGNPGWPPRSRSGLPNNPIIICVISVRRITKVRHSTRSSRTSSTRRASRATILPLQSWKSSDDYLGKDVSVICGDGLPLMQVSVCATANRRPNWRCSPSRGCGKHWSPICCHCRPDAHYPI